MIGPSGLPVAPERTGTAEPLAVPPAMPMPSASRIGVIVLWLSVSPMPASGPISPDLTELMASSSIGGAVGPLLLHGDDGAVDHVAEVGLGVEEDQVPLERRPDLVGGGVEAPDDRRHGVGEARALQPLVVVVGVGEEGPQRPRPERDRRGSGSNARLARRPGVAGAARPPPRRRLRSSAGAAASDEVEVEVGQGQAEGRDDHQRHGSAGDGHEDEADEEVGDHRAPEDEAHVHGDADRREHPARDDQPVDRPERQAGSGRPGRMRGR